MLLARSGPLILFITVFQACGGGGGSGDSPLGALLLLMGGKTNSASNSSSTKEGALPTIADCQSSTTYCSSTTGMPLDVGADPYSYSYYDSSVITVEPLFSGDTSTLAARDSVNRIGVKRHCFSQVGFKNGEKCYLNTASAVAYVVHTVRTSSNYSYYSLRTANITDTTASMESSPEMLIPVAKSCAVTSAAYDRVLNGGSYTCSLPASNYRSWLGYREPASPLSATTILYRGTNTMHCLYAQLALTAAGFPVDKKIYTGDIPASAGNCTVPPDAAKLDDSSFPPIHSTLAAASAASPNNYSCLASQTSYCIDQTSCVAVGGGWCTNNLYCYASPAQAASNCPGSPQSPGSGGSQGLCPNGDSACCSAQFPSPGAGRCGCMKQPHYCSADQLCYADFVSYSQACNYGFTPTGPSTNTTVLPPEPPPPPTKCAKGDAGCCMFKFWQPEYKQEYCECMGKPYYDAGTHSCYATRKAFDTVHQPAATATCGRLGKSCCFQDACLDGSVCGTDGICGGTYARCGSANQCKSGFACYSGQCFSQFGAPAGDSPSGSGVAGSVSFTMTPAAIETDASGRPLNATAGIGSCTVQYIVQVSVSSHSCSGLRPDSSVKIAGFSNVTAGWNCGWDSYHGFQDRKVGAGQTKPLHFACVNNKSCSSLYSTPAFTILASGYCDF